MFENTGYLVDGAAAFVTCSAVLLTKALSLVLLVFLALSEVFYFK